jgi:hypothetical protein
MAEKIFFSSAEHSLHNAIQLIAVLIQRQGGEVLIDQREFSRFEGVPVKGTDYGSHIVLRLGDEDELQEVELPFES